MKHYFCALSVTFCWFFPFEEKTGDGRISEFSSKTFSDKLVPGLTNPATAPRRAGGPHPTSKRDREKTEIHGHEK